MGCGGDREKGPSETSQKWEFLTLTDFHATSTWNYIAYTWMWFMSLVAIAVYALDTFTAVNLLFFKHWASQVQPALAFKYSRWIFTSCILLSWTLCLYSWIRAIRVMRRDGVAESYMDPLAVNLQSMRPKGWKRFLVYTELTKSKKGADYVAFFVYFAFNGALRVILAEGPRQFVNGMTLYSVMQAKLEVHGGPDNGNSSIGQFFDNLQTLANDNVQQMLIYCSMLGTLVIWVFSALSLIVAAILYLVFLWHYIPQRDGRLSIYCRRKIDKRLEKVVEHKVKAALEEEDRQKRKEVAKAELKRQKTGEDLSLPQKPILMRQPTLPQLGDSPHLQQDEKKSDFGLVRQDTSTTVSTLPPYSSRPPTRNELRRQPTLPDLEAERPAMPSRMGTQGSAWTSASYESDAPLLANAGYAGQEMPPAFDRQFSQASYHRPMPGRQGSNASFQRPIQGRQGSDARFHRPMPERQGSQATQGSQRSFTPTANISTVNTRPPPGMRGPPMRSDTSFSFDNQPQSAISPPAGYGRAMAPHSRSNTADGFPPANRYQPPRSHTTEPPTRPMVPTYGSLHSQNSSSFSRPIQRRASPPRFVQALSPPGPPSTDPPTAHTDSYEMTSRPTYTSTMTTSPPPDSTRSYTPFNPSRMNSPLPPPPAAILPAGLQPGPRHNTPGAGDYFGHVPQRSATAPAEARLTTGYGDILDAYGRSSSVSPMEGSGPQRSNTTQPGSSQGWQNHF